MSEQKTTCACSPDCGVVLSPRNTSGYARGHRQRVLASQGVLAEARRRAEIESREQPVTAEPVADERPVALSRGRHLILACAVHNAYVEIRSLDGAKPPPPDTRRDLCSQCVEAREARTSTARDERYLGVMDGLRPAQTISMEAWTQWNEVQEQLGVVRPHTMAEAEALAWIDEARVAEQREVDRLRAGRRRGGRHYVAPAYRDVQFEDFEDFGYA